MPRPLQGSGRYMAGLDGLRALAVLAVIAYHLNWRGSPGGLLGVDIFFVLSGYLITDILKNQWEQHQRLLWKEFWLRRARRLLPALGWLLVVVIAWITLFDRSQLATLRGDVLAAVLYISNWWLIFHHVSYFASFGPPSPLGHLWSLAVEEQFYLVWPLVLSLCLRYVPRRGLLFCLTLIGAAFSALAMGLLYQPGTDPSRVYYGTDTRAFALLIGAALALVWPSRQLSSTLSSPKRLTLDMLGGSGLIVILLMIARTNQYQDFLYPNGMVLLSVATAVLVAALAHPASRLGQLLGCQPLRWLGVRSYGIYLWHYPVIVLTSPAVDTGAFPFTRALLQIALSIALAALSWRFLEEPIRGGAVGRWWKLLHDETFSWRLLQSRQVLAIAVPLAAGVFCLGIACVGMAAPSNADPNPAPPFVATIGGTPPASTNSADAMPKPDTSQPSADPPSKTDASAANPNSNLPHPPANSTPKTNASTPPAKPNPDTANPAPDSPSQPAAATTPPNTDAAHPSTDSAPPTPSTPQSGKGITAIGDSVMLDVGPYLEKLLPGIVVDGKIGRQMYQAPDVVTQLKKEGKLGKIVIIELGTNGPFTKAQLQSLLNTLGQAQRILLINTRVPRPWQDVVNSTLADAAASSPNITLVNWYQASADKNSYFYPDGVHPNPEGSQFYASLVAKAIASAKE